MCGKGTGTGNGAGHVPATQCMTALPFGIDFPGPLNGRHQVHARRSNASVPRDNRQRCTFPGAARLALPEMDMSDVAEAAADEGAVEAAEQALLSWTSVISKTLQSESGKAAAPGGPMCEVDFWRARHAASPRPKAVPGCVNIIGTMPA